MDTGNNILVTTDETPRIKKRSAWAAFFFAYFCPGLGHFYCGKVKKALIFYFLSLIILTIILSLLKFKPSIYVLLSLIFLACPFSIYMYVDSVRTAKKEKNYVLKSYNKWFMYLSIILFHMILNYPLSLLYPSTFSTPTGSMENTILPGDRFFANNLAYGIQNPVSGEYIIEFSKPQIGDVIAFDFPGKRDEVNPKEKVSYLKRIIAMPGDTLLIRNGSIIINNNFYNLPETAKKEDIYLLIKETPDPNIFPKGSGWNAGKYGPLVIPKQNDILDLNFDNIEKWKVFIEREGNTVRTDGKIKINDIETDKYKVKRNYYFVIGDNISNSFDSRYIGFIPENSILCKLTMIYFSWDRNIPYIEFGKLINSIRWNRIGQIVK